MRNEDWWARNLSQRPIERVKNMRWDAPGYLEMKIKWKQNMQCENNLTGEIMKINCFENENEISDLFQSWQYSFGNCTRLTLISRLLFGVTGIICL